MHPLASKQVDASRVALIAGDKFRETTFNAHRPEEADLIVKRQVDDKQHGVLAVLRVRLL